MVKHRNSDLPIPQVGYSCGLDLQSARKLQPSCKLSAGHREMGLEAESALCSLPRMKEEPSIFFITHYASLPNGYDGINLK